MRRGNGIAINSRSQLSDIVNKLSSDFLSYNDISPWTGTVVSSGTTNSSLSGSNKHNGIRIYVSGTSANSGYGYLIGTNQMTLNGGEETTFIFKTHASQATITRRMGFHNTVESSSPTDGVFFDIGVLGEGQIRGVCKNNSISAVTNTSYTLSNDTWFRAVIQINSDLTLATFKLYADDSNTVLWTGTITTNIPVNRTLGHGDIATSSGTTAITLGYLDYMDIVIPNARRVA